MPEPATMTRARLEEIDLTTGNLTDKELTVDVQFNPESLTVTYTNTIGGEDQSGGASIQRVSQSSTKLAVELWFDASTKPTSANGESADVRLMTGKVKHFFTPSDEDRELPGVRFIWGSFLFQGVMQSLDETLEFFSAEGRPLRAKIAISIASQEIQNLMRESKSNGAAAPGTRPQKPATDGEGLQQMLGRSGNPEGWQAVASANGIENPRFLEPGSFVDPSAGRGAPGRTRPQIAGR